MVTGLGRVYGLLFVRRVCLVSHEKRDLVLLLVLCCPIARVCMPRTRTGHVGRKKRFFDGSCRFELHVLKRPHTLLPSIPNKSRGCAFMMSSATSVLSPSWLPPSSCFLDKHDENKENQLDWANAVSSSDDEITARTDEDEPNEPAATTRAATRKGLREKRTREDPACLSVSRQYRIRKVPVSQERVLKQHKTRRSPLYRVVPLVADGFIMGL
jgi:hypothetical protein